MEPKTSETEVAQLATVNLDEVKSAVLRRLIAEVRRDATVVKSYDRSYNRHNRS